MHRNDRAPRASEVLMRRWPLIRHVRYFYARWRVNQHYAMWGRVGALPHHADKDYEVLDAIWRGER
jgi:hypothetical protein